MITHIFIVLIILIEFIGLLMAKERIKYYTAIAEKKQEDLTPVEKKVLVRLVFRVIVSIVYLGIMIYFLFVPVLFVYALLTLTLSILIFILMSKVQSIKGKVFVARTDAILTILIWLGPFLQILKMVF